MPDMSADVIPLPTARPPVTPIKTASTGRLATKPEIDALATTLVRDVSLCAAGWSGHSQACAVAQALATMVTAQTRGRPIGIRMAYANRAVGLIEEEARRRAWEIIRAEAVDHG